MLKQMMRAPVVPASYRRLRLEDHQSVEFKVSLGNIEKESISLRQSIKNNNKFQAI